jgi:DNA-binding GntR family transcriptional regulator
MSTQENTQESTREHTVASLTTTAPPAAKGNVQGWIYDQIFAAILEQRLAPDTKLAEDTLGEIFGVSRTVIRAVLQRLSHDHVVEIRPNRGAVVASLSIAEVQDVFEARRVIENGALDLACKRRSKNDVADLKMLVAREQDAFEGDDKSAWIRLSGEFHLQLAAISGNKSLSDMLRTLVSRTSLAISQYETPGRSACSQKEHFAIIQAIEAGDIKAAQREMTRHLAECEAKLDLEEQDSGSDLHAIFSDVRVRNDKMDQQS